MVKPIFAEVCGGINCFQLSFCLEERRQLSLLEEFISNCESQFTLKASSESELQMKVVRRLKWGPDVQGSNFKLFEFRLGLQRLWVRFQLLFANFLPFQSDLYQCPQTIKIESGSIRSQPSIGWQHYSHLKSVSFFLMKTIFDKRKMHLSKTQNCWSNAIYSWWSQIEKRVETALSCIFPGQQNKLSQFKTFY